MSRIAASLLGRILSDQRCPRPRDLNLGYTALFIIVKRSPQQATQALKFQGRSRSWPKSACTNG
jgi:hypothetical protein